MDIETSYLKSRLLAVRVWSAIGCAILFVSGVMALGYLSEALELLSVGVIIGFIISPVTNWLEDRGLNRSLAALMALVLFLLIVWLVGSIILPPFFEQAIELFKRIPDYSPSIQAEITDLFTRFGNTQHLPGQLNVTSFIGSLSKYLVESSQSVVTKLSTGLVINILSTLNLMVVFFLGLVMAYWLAKDYPKIVKEFATIAGPHHKDDIVLLFAVMSRSMGGYMRGVVIMALIDGFLSFLGFSVIGHPYAGLMGTMVGLLSFIPVVGPWVAAMVAALVALFVSPMLALESILVVVVIKNATDNLIYPLVMQSAVKVHPALSLLAIAVGASLAGVLGMTLAIPLSAAIKGVFVYYFETRTGRQLVSNNGALFKSTPFRDQSGKILPAFDALDDAKFFETSRLVSEPEEEIAPLEKDTGREGLDLFVDTLQSAWKKSKTSHKDK